MFMAALVIIAQTGNSPHVLQHVTVGQAVALSNREEPVPATHNLQGTVLSGQKIKKPVPKVIYSLIPFMPHC